MSLATPDMPIQRSTVSYSGRKIRSTRPASRHRLRRVRRGESRRGGSATIEPHSGIVLPPTALAMRGKCPNPRPRTGSPRIGPGCWGSKVPLLTGEQRNSGLSPGKSPALNHGPCGSRQMTESPAVASALPRLRRMGRRPLSGRRLVLGRLASPLCPQLQVFVLGCCKARGTLSRAAGHASGSWTSSRIHMIGLKQCATSFPYGTDARGPASPTRPGRT